jgi:GxxExxY protein
LQLLTAPAWRAANQTDTKAKVAEGKAARHLSAVLFQEPPRITRFLRLPHQCTARHHASPANIVSFKDSFRSCCFEQSWLGNGLMEQEATEITEGNRQFSLCQLSFQEERSMHPLFSRAAGMTHDVIGAAIEVHKTMGPGLLESIYEWCLTMELQLRGHQVQNQEQVVICYKQFVREEPLRFDMLIDGCLFVEVKAVDKVHPIHKAQLLSYMKLLDLPLGLIINFHVLKLTDGVSRLILPGANRE